MSPILESQAFLREAERERKRQKVRKIMRNKQTETERKRERVRKMKSDRE
jgi:hypothetical protein